MDDPNLAILIPIAQALGDLCESLVLVAVALPVCY